VATTGPQAVAWSVELRSSGQVCADVRRGRSRVYALAGGLMCAVAAGATVAAGTGGRIVAGALLLLGLAITTTSVQQVLRVGSWRSPQVVVDADGVTVRHGRLRVPWPELAGAIGYTLQHNRWVGLVPTDAWYDAWLAAQPWWVRLLNRPWRRRRGRWVNLPPNLDVDHLAFATWLTDETRQRMVSEQQSRP
jgi:hypothetical protein